MELRIEKRSRHSGGDQLVAVNEAGGVIMRTPIQFGHARPETDNNFVQELVHALEDYAGQN